MKRKNVRFVCFSGFFFFQYINYYVSIDTYASMSDARNVLDTLVGWASFNLNTLSMTEISVDVVLMPTNALQSLTTHPAPSTSLPRFTVPACEIEMVWVNYRNEQNRPCQSGSTWMIRTTSGTCNNDDNSSWSSVEVFGCTIPPWLLRTVYDPTSTLLATVWRNTSTFNTSPMISSVSYR